MKFTITCLVSSVNSALLTEAEKLTKDVVVANPQATVQNLRATVAIQFRLNVMAFDFRFDHHNSQAAPAEDTGAPSASSSSSPSAATSVIDWSDEKKLLAECGLRDGDHLTVLPKQQQQQQHRLSTTSDASGVEEGYGGPTKKARLEESNAADEGDGEASELSLSGDQDKDEEDSDDSDDSDDDADSTAPAQSDLFDALREVVPDLTILRQEFLSNPQAVMERIERNHPSLFQVITQNQETFIQLMNNEQLTKAAQSMLHGRPALGAGSDDDEEQSLEWSMNGEGEEGEGEDEEMDEETEAQMRQLFEQYIAAGGADGDFDVADLAALEASGMEVGDVDEDAEQEGEAQGDATTTETTGATTGSKKKSATSEKDFILARVPSEEDEKKIVALTELGFTYEQCKLAFYLCHRSIDRASNRLFEAPPEI